MSMMEHLPSLCIEIHMCYILIVMSESSYTTGSLMILLRMRVSVLFNPVQLQFVSGFSDSLALRLALRGSGVRQVHGHAHPPAPASQNFNKSCPCLARTSLSCPLSLLGYASSQTNLWENREDTRRPRFRGAFRWSTSRACVNMLSDVSSLTDLSSDDDSAFAPNNKGKNKGKASEYTLKGSLKPPRTVSYSAKHLYGMFV